MRLYAYATATPSPIKVNMLRLRFTSDCQARTKKGHPPHSTTGVASASSNHPRPPDDARRSRGRPGSRSPMAIAASGTVRTTPAQNRRVMSISSGFSASSAASRGSSAIPQIGHVPGESRTICGCMGHTHCVRAGGAWTAGSRSIPHCGQLPGVDCRTSGCIGHVYAPGEGGVSGWARGCCSPGREAAM